MTRSCDALEVDFLGQRFRVKLCWRLQRRNKISLRDMSARLRVCDGALSVWVVEE
jgi:hypothetical protein